jgi:hypothetical protein
VGNTEQSENFFDETPGVNVDLLGPEVGFETNYFEEIATSFKAYFAELLKPIFEY